MNKPTISYKRHRFQPQIISHAVWLYFRFPLSLRLVEEMLLERGIFVPYETIRRWGKKFGLRASPSPQAAQPERRLASGRSGHHHRRKKHWLWRAVDQNG